MRSHLMAMAVLLMLAVVTGTLLGVVVGVGRFVAGLI